MLFCPFAGGIDANSRTLWLFPSTVCKVADGTVCFFSVKFR